MCLADSVESKWKMIDWRDQFLLCNILEDCFQLGIVPRGLLWGAVILDRPKVGDAYTMLLSKNP